MEEKKIVLVTGGTSGIGLGTIEYLLEQGNYDIISLGSICLVDGGKSI